MLQEYGIPRKITQIIKILYDRFKSKISHEGKFSEFIDVRNGVRQGCFLSPTLCFFANIRQSSEKNERLKEEMNRVDYERKTGRLGLRR
jgi:hypothetical protein